MRYALIDTENRIAAIADVDSPDDWSYPEGFFLVDAEGFYPEHDPGDYEYRDGGFVYIEPVNPLEPHEVFAAVFAAKPEMIEELPDESLERMAIYMEEWAPDTAYAVGNVRSYEEQPYRCVQAHTSQIGWEPPNVKALWTKIAREGEIPVWEQPTGAQDAYQKGDKVHYPTASDPVYESDADNNVWAPDVYGWHLVE